MTDYSLGKICRIVCNISGLTYYGSTCEPTLARRLAGHVALYKRFKDGKKRSIVTSYKVLDGGNYSIVLVELFPCNSKMELHQRERFHIENNDCINKNIPTRTPEEYNATYRLNNKKKIHEYASDYKLNNLEKLREQEANWRLNNKEKIMEQHANWRLRNSEKVKINGAKYRLKMKEAKLAKLLSADILA